MNLPFNLKPLYVRNPVTGKNSELNGDNLWDFIGSMVFLAIGLTLLFGTWFGGWNLWFIDAFNAWGLSLGASTNLFWLIIVIIFVLFGFFLGEADLYEVE